MDSGIYKISNKTDNKCYIGSSKQLTMRKKRHFRDLKNKKHHNLYLQRAFNKYGQANFIFEIIKFCSVKHLHKEEQKAFDKYKPEYNLGKISGGDNIRNHPKNKQFREKQSNIQKQRLSKLNKKQRQKIFGRPGSSNGNWKGGVSKKYCRKCDKPISYSSTMCIKCTKIGSNNPFYGKKHSSKTIKKLKNREIDRSKIANIGKYLVILSNNKQINFLGLSEISKYFGVTNAAVHKVLKQERPNKKGKMKNVIIRRLDQ